MRKKLYVMCMFIVAIIVCVGCGNKNETSKETDVTPTLVTTALPTQEVVTQEPVTKAPTTEVTEEPVEDTTKAPEMEATNEPTDEATKGATGESVEPTKAPVEEPTAEPTSAPTMAPGDEPTIEPTTQPGDEPTAKSTIEPDDESTKEPTKAPTKSPTKAPLEIVDYVEESKSKTTDFKYGVKKVVTTVTYYNVYSDGSKKVDYTYSYNDYDVSGYSATDAELMDETKKVQASNMTYYEEVLDLVNAIRTEVGVPPLVLDVKMCKAATMRALEMDYSGLFSHTRPDGRSCFDVLDTFNIECWGCGENIAAGYGSPKAVVEGWKNSPGHYSNMINEGYTKMGVGRSNQGIGGYGDYWAQLFAG